LIDDKLEIGDDIFNTLASARILSTRGYGIMIQDAQINEAINFAPNILNWMNRLSKASHYE
jgi:hypothetical protein